MNLINGNIREYLSLWAKENEDANVFPKISDEVTSYYITRNSKQSYIKEYAFENMQELASELERYSGLPEKSQLLKKMTVAICENRYKSYFEGYGNEGERKYDEGIVRGDEEKELPDFIYIF
ncbi:MAG: hypothetical protein NC489_23270 [Ruminococcus flavefaciens]|nr:hypothetical protein [Ruminococcus flavefaciens]